MWFMFLALALVVVTIGGIYFRRRVLQALGTLGVSRRVLRPTGWAILWLLFGFPTVFFLFRLITLIIGRQSFSDAVGPTIAWLLAYPFWMAVLVMLQTVPFLLAFDLFHLVTRERVVSDTLARYRAIGCLVVTLGFALYTPARIAIERAHLDVHEYQLSARDGEVQRAPGDTTPETTPDAAPPFRIAFLADLQRDRETGRERAAQVVDLVNGANPDIILVGGDWINSGPNFIAEAGRTAGELRSRLGTFSVRGDHEHFAYRDRTRSLAEVEAALAENGVAMLDNEVRWVEHHGQRIAIIYLSYNYIVRTPEAGIRQLLDQVPGADFSILVTHQFDNDLAALVADRVDLVLAAHTHGGQVNPVVGLTHVSLAAIETDYVEGRYGIGATTVIVTAGIGFSIAPFRYASPASIEIIELSL